MRVKKFGNLGMMLNVLFTPFFSSQEIRYFSEVYDNIKTLTDAVEESPSDIALWIKLSRLQLHQTHDDNGEGQDMGLMQCLNTLSRGLEANPNSQVLSCSTHFFFVAIFVVALCYIGQPFFHL